MSEPIKLNNSDVKNVPNRTPAIIRHEAILVYRSIINPKRINKVEVSPIEPGMEPKNASLHEY